MKDTGESVLATQPDLYWCLEQRIIFAYTLWKILI